MGKGSRARDHRTVIFRVRVGGLCFAGILPINIRRVIMTVPSVARRWSSARCYCTELNSASGCLFDGQGSFEHESPAAFHVESV